MSRIGKPIETESRLVIARGWEEGEWEMIANGFGVPLWGNENVLELDSSNGCIILYIY